VDVSGDAGTGGFADVHAEVDAVGDIKLAQDGLQFLGESHHFGGRGGGEFLQLVEVRVGYDHDVSVGVGIGIKDDEAMLSAVNDEGLAVGFFGGIAEDAAGFLGGAGNVGVTPRGPEMIHGGRVAERRCGLRAAGWNGSGIGLGRIASAAKAASDYEAVTARLKSCPSQNQIQLTSPFQNKLKLR
jgi:hypothetical protein